jgi:hypothetical protein
MLVTLLEAIEKLERVPVLLAKAGGPDAQGRPWLLVPSAAAYAAVAPPCASLASAHRA